MFETTADHSFATSLDDAGANEQVLSAEFGVAHPLSILLEIAALLANGHIQFRRRGVHREEADQLCDVFLIEFGLVSQDPTLLADPVTGMNEPRPARFQPRAQASR